MSGRCGVRFENWISSCEEINVRYCFGSENWINRCEDISEGDWVGCGGIECMCWWYKRGNVSGEFRRYFKLEWYLIFWVGVF